MQVLRAVCNQAKLIEDYVDYLEVGIEPHEDSQYYVALSFKKYLMKL